MNRTRWWQVTAVVPAHAADAVANLIEEAFAAPPVLVQRAAHPSVTVTVYVQAPNPPEKNQRNELTAKIRFLVGTTTPGFRVRLRVSPLADKNWRESWKKHLRPIQVGKSLLIRPSWSRRKGNPRQSTVVLDPGLAFGTGHHPTTRYCLLEIVRLRNPQTELSLLDVGTGSGIIAIAAAKLGYAPVRAIDIDPDSIRTATANARRNRVHRRIQFLVVDLCRLPQESWPRHHIVCANLNLDLLLTSGKKLSALLQPGGFLILAGVLHSEFPIVENHYAQLGFRLVRSKVDGGWRSGTFVLST